MEAKDSPEFFAYLTSIAGLYGKEITAATSELWFNVLKKYPLDTVRAAFQAYVVNPESHFMPVPADIIKSIEGSAVDNAVVAWQLVYDAVCSLGMDASVAFADVVTMQAITDMGGWQQLCGMTNQEAPFRQKDFERLYRALSSRREFLSPPKRFVGTIEAHNDGVDFGDKKAPQITTHFVGADGGRPMLAGKVGGDGRKLIAETACKAV